MDCREFELFVHAYIDGEFDAHEQVMVESHLASCVSCRARAKHERMFREQLRTSYHAVAESAPASLRARICASLSSNRAAPADANAPPAVMFGGLDALSGADDLEPPDDAFWDDLDASHDDHLLDADDAALAAIVPFGRLSVVTSEDDADAPDASVSDVVATDTDASDTDDAIEEVEAPEEVAAAAPAIASEPVELHEDAPSAAEPEHSDPEEAAAAIERISAELEAIALDTPAPVAAVAPELPGTERAPRVGTPRRRAPRWARRLLAPAVSAAAAIVVLAGAWSMHDQVAPAPAQETPAESSQATAPGRFLDDSAERDEGELGPEPIVQEAVTWHQRDVPVEVTGPSDRRVRRWFHGKVNFPVRLPRFENNHVSEVNLLGARLSNVREKQAAYVIYEANGSKLSVMVFNRSRNNHPARRAARKADVVRAAAMRRPVYFQNANGYNVAVVEDNGVTYSITSELPREEMVELVDAAFRP